MAVQSIEPVSKSSLFISMVVQLVMHTTYDIKTSVGHHTTVCWCSVRWCHAAGYTDDTDDLTWWLWWKASKGVFSCFLFFRCGGVPTAQWSIFIQKTPKTVF